MGLRLAAWLLALTTLTGCDGGGCSKRPPPEKLAAPLDVTLSGCETVLRDGTCAIGSDRKLRVWVDAPETSKLSVRAGQALLEVDRSVVEGGVLIRFEVPVGAERVDVHVEGSAGAGHRALSLQDASVAQPVRGMQQAKKKRDCGRVASLADEHVSTLAAADRARAESLVARCNLSSGQFQAAVAGLRRAAELHREAGNLSDELIDQVTLVYVLTFFRRDLSEARKLADTIADRLESVPEALAHGTYHHALLLRELGDLRSALRLLRESERRFRIVGLEDRTVAVRKELAGVLLKLGRADEAARLLEREIESLPADAPACAHALLDNNLGWSLLEGAATGEHIDAKDVEDARLHLSRALEMAKTKCKNPREERNVHLNLARAALLLGDTRACEKHLAEARSVEGPGDVLLAVWMDSLEGATALRRGQGQAALRSFERMEARAQRAVLPSAAWRAKLGLAEAHELLGHDDLALQAYTEAESLLDEQLRLVPVMEGIETFLAGRQRGARLFVDLLVRVGRHDQAFRVARKARVRALLSTRWVDRIGQLEGSQRAKWDAAISAYRQQRAALNQATADDWKLSVDQLRALEREREESEAAVNTALEEAFAVLNRAAGPAWETSSALPPEGEAVLLVQPVRDGCVGFLADTQALHVEPLGNLADVAPERLGDALLKPFDEVLKRAKRIRILAHGPLQETDVHAVVYEGAPVVARWEVVYGADVRVAREARPKQHRSGVLIVADPRRDLPAARKEADEVKKALSGGGSDALRLLQGDQATHAALVAALPAVELFHYAGHGEVGRDTSWSSQLPLAEGSGLTVGDILSLTSAPESVVLSGCDTARDKAKVVEGLGLAQAFILNGSKAVVATARPVKDELARLLMSAMYGHIAQGVPLSEALSRAQNDVRKAHPSADWGSFRALGP